MSNLKEIYNKIKTQTQKVLETDVADTIKKVEHKHVYEDVYNVYPFPKRYIRHKDEYGLSDERNMIVKKYGDVGIEISNDTYHEDADGINGKYVADVVETGVGYEFTGYGYAYEQARPFQEKTVEELEMSKEHIQALKKGLQNKGIKTD